MGIKGEALVLTCMDLRQMDEVAEYLGTPGQRARRNQNGTAPDTAEGLRDLYDHVAMAGASLGAISSLKPHWNQAFWDHVELAITLHDVKRLIIIEHQDCGAYKAFFLPASRRNVIGENAARSGWQDEEGEAACHYRMASALRDEVLRRGINLSVEVLYAALPYGTAHASIRCFTQHEIDRARKEEAEDQSAPLDASKAP